MRRALFLVPAAAAILCAMPPVSAARPADTDVLRAAPLGPIVDAPDGKSEMELVRFDERVVATLQTLAPEESIRVEDWPVAPGRRASVVLRRFDVYAPDAKIVVVEDGVEREAPRSRHAFYRGTVGDGADAGSSFAAWLDPETGRIGGIAMTGLGTVVLEPGNDPKDGPARLATAKALALPGVAPAWSCGVPDEDADPLWRELQRARRDRPEPQGVTGGSVSALGTLSKSAVIAFDTDAEYLNLRFANNTANATTYIAQLVAGMSVIYERDVASVKDNGVKMLQGYTILRVGETSDPYSDTTGTADSTKLTEFRDYWNTHYPSTVIRRALAALLSGRQGSGNSASGIATVAALCSTSGYSIDQLFTNDHGVASDLLILAHEVGHNFGAFHTHNCWYGTPPIDSCVTPEGGCGSATGCPGAQVFNGVTTNGTLMSYCHTLNSGPPLYTPLCSPSALVFHTRSITDDPVVPLPYYDSDSVLSEVAAASCLSTLSGGVVPAAPTISAVSPSSGPLAGGTSLTITGTNFASGATVAFVELPSNDVFGTPSSKVAGSVTFNSATQLTVTTPSAANTGAVDVVVMNPDRQTATRASGFTYTSGPVAPTVTSVSPNFGTTAGGTAVTITGTGFVATPTVSFGGSAATGVSWSSSTTLTATTPAHAAGAVNVVVRNPDAQSGTLASGYAYVVPGAGTKWYPLTPCRIIDTRNANGPLGGPVLAANQTRLFDVTTNPTTCGIPSTARSLTVNYAVTGGQQTGEIRAFAGDSVWTGTSVISFSAGQTRSNNGHLGLAANGTGTCTVVNGTSGTVHFILDVNGYFQ